MVVATSVRGGIEGAGGGYYSVRLRNVYDIISSLVREPSSYVRIWICEAFRLFFFFLFYNRVCLGYIRSRLLTY